MNERQATPGLVQVFFSIMAGMFGAQVIESVRKISRSVNRHTTLCRARNDSYFCAVNLGSSFAGDEICGELILPGLDSFLLFLQVIECTAENSQF